MEIRTEQMTKENLKILEQLLSRNYRWLKKILMWTPVILGVFLFVPAEILSLFSRGRNRGVSGQLYFELGPINVIKYIVVPTVIILILIYIFFLHIPTIKRDLKNKEKEVVTIKVKEIKELSARVKKDFMGVVDHVLKFETNPFNINETYFSKSREAAFFQATAFTVELSKYARIELERKMIENAT